MIKPEYKNPILAGISATIFIVTLVFMASITDVRTKELQAKLNEIGRANRGGNAGALISRYQMLAQSQKKKALNKSDDYKREAQVQLVMAAALNENVEEKGNFASFLNPATVRILNLFAALAGSSQTVLPDREEKNKYLQLAYYYERHRKFKKAIQAYDAALRELGDDDPHFKHYISLHRGFCKSFVGELDSAIEDYRTVRNESKVLEMVQAADKLIEYAKRFRKLLESIPEDAKPSIKLAERLYYAMAYKRAVTTLKKIVPKSKGTNKRKALYLKGRSLEELGKTKKAIKNYKRVLADNKKDKYTTLSNRRLYMLGTFYNADKKVATQATKKATKLKDTGFIKSMKKSSARMAAAPDLPDLESQYNEQLATIASPEVEEEVQEETTETAAQPKKVAKAKAKALPSEPKEEATPAPPPEPPKKKITVANIKQEMAKVQSKKEKRKLLMKSFKYLDKVSMKDGNIFVGKILKKHPDGIDFIAEIGTAFISNDDIEATSTVKSQIYDGN